MQSLLRRLSLLLLLVVGTAHGGMLKDMATKVIDMLSGPECNDKCKTAAHERGKMLIEAHDKDSDGHLLGKEFETIMEALFQMKDKSGIEEQYKIICQNLKCDPKVGLNAATFKYIFHHKVWREKLNRVFSMNDL